MAHQVQFRASPSSLNVRLLEQSGATVERHADWMPVIRISTPEAMKEFVRQASRKDLPGVQAVHAPGVPPDDVIEHLRCVAEANSIIEQRAATTAGALVPPSFFPSLPVPFNSGLAAVTTVLDAISNPGPVMPTIHTQPPGTILAHVQYIWKNCMCVVPVARA
jgi:hypothetical protein